ncbi:hypothetical protein [uncultured Duncaniella sp.]|uniref:hypothetical protein n=1 Tax=uncultured Duncaniella sp. TaxID=2768039 RepID=UPI0025DCF97F|nr:hypothetical protein [uncultured Duncaniella sp.]
MQKVIIIGCPGAGKSTFGRKLADVTGLPLHYLDMIWHRPDRTTVSREEFDKQLDSLLDGDRWIIDGNYIRTLPLRLFRCDTVFMFDLPLEVCLAGAEERLGKERVDMPWTDTVLDEEFRQWILDFPKMQLPLINLFLDSYNGTVVRFKSRREADEYIIALKSASKPD